MCTYDAQIFSENYFWFKEKAATFWYNDKILQNHSPEHYDNRRHAFKWLRYALKKAFNNEECVTASCILVRWEPTRRGGVLVFQAIRIGWHGNYCSQDSDCEACSNRCYTGERSPNYGTCKKHPHWGHLLTLPHDISFQLFFYLSHL